MKYPKSHIPNSEGYKILAHFLDGTSQVVEVKKNEKGMHYLEDWSKIENWSFVK